MITRGELLAQGRTSRVYAFGEDSVLKVLRESVPAHWAGVEAKLTALVHAQGLPVPAVRDVVRLDGREAIVFERVRGESLWNKAMTGEWSAESVAAELSEIHLRIVAEQAPSGMPELVERLQTKLGGVQQLSESERKEAVDLSARLPRGAKLLHGDLHPANVLVGTSGPVVIDWFDSASGHPSADIVRSSLLLRPWSGVSGAQHLPGSTRQLLSQMHEAYVLRMAEVHELDSSDVRVWESVVAACRLTEGAQSDEISLKRLWNQRATTDPSPLLELL